MNTLACRMCNGLRDLYFTQLKKFPGWNFSASYPQSWLNLSGSKCSGSKPPGSKLTGYSLLELLTSLTIMGIVSSMSLPLFNIVKTARTVSVTNQLVRTLHLARSEAIKTGKRATLCQSRSGTKCDRGEQWEQGWILFHDPNKNVQVDPDESIVLVGAALQSGYTITWRPSGRRRDYVSFQPQGSANKSGTFSICSTEGSDKARTVVLYRTGRVRTSTRKPGNKPADCPV